MADRPSLRSIGWVRLSVAAATVAALLLLGPVAAVGAAPAQGAVAACLELPTMSASEDCPSIKVSVTGTADDETLTFALENASGDEWNGSPVGVELVADGLDAPTPDGTIEEGPADSLWVTRGGILVARCTFAEPVAPLPEDGSTSCALPRLGLEDGTHTAWITGAIGGQLVGPELGSEPLADGVVPVARPVSVEFELIDDEVVVSKAATPAEPIDAAEAAEGFNAPGDQASGSESSTDPSPRVGLWITGGLTAAVLVALVAWALRRRRRGGPGTA